MNIKRFFKNKFLAYLLGGISLALPLFLLILATPFINGWAVFVVGLVTEFGWLISMEYIYGITDFENRKLKKILKNNNIEY